jgi:hypothetical protein
MVWWYTPVTPATQEARIRNTAVRGQSGQNGRETCFSTTKLGVVVHIVFPVNGEGSINRRIKV